MKTQSAKDIEKVKVTRLAPVVQLVERRPCKAEILRVRSLPGAPNINLRK
jgi:hypothetical protein